MDRLTNVLQHFQAPDVVLIANRGEIAVRISRAAAAENLKSIAIYGSDDSKSLHVVRCDEKVQLQGSGTSAYLDAHDIVRAAKQSRARYIAPGYGFLRYIQQFHQQILSFIV